MPTPTERACRAEIESLHDFFVAWYTGRADGLDRLEAVVAPGFGMVTPDAERVGRGDVIDSVRETREMYDPGTFDIDIRNIDVVDRQEGQAVVRYEEWQRTPEGTSGRLSTAFFRADSDTPNGLSWVAVHETWIES
jgi:hypothetical protein